MNREDLAAVQACRSLYDLLLLPVQRSIRQMNVKELTIVAHDIITLVPFSALMDQENRYLSEVYEVREVPSIFVCEQLVSSRHSNDLLAGNNPP
eukprot:gene808-895_t